MDLAELVAHERYLAVSDYLEMLPQASRTWGALFDDEEYAALVVEASLDRDEETAGPWSPAYKDWSFTNELLVQTYDAIQQLTYTTAKVQGAKPRKPKQFPRPQTAIDRAKAKLARESSESILTAFGREVPDWDVRVVPNE